VPPGTILIQGTDGRTHNILCYNCNGWEHYADNCPAREKTNASLVGSTLMQYSYALSQSEDDIPREWILLDSCSTDSVFNNCSFLHSIVACDDKEAITMKSNGGRLEYILKSTLKFFPLEVFNNEHSLANIISLFDFIRVPGIVVTLDSREDPGFSVMLDAKLYYFAPFKNGLYYFDTCVGPRSVNNIKFNTKFSPYSLLQTVADNKKFSTASTRD